MAWYPPGLKILSLERSQPDFFHFLGENSTNTHYFFDERTFLEVHILSFLLLLFFIVFVSFFLFLFIQMQFLFFYIAFKKWKNIFYEFYFLLKIFSIKNDSHYNVTTFFTFSLFSLLLKFLCKLCNGYSTEILRYRNCRFATTSF